METPSIPRTRHQKIRHGRSVQTTGPSLDSILEEICGIFEARVEDVMSEKKTEELVNVRRLYYYVASEITNVKQDIIATLINRDRSCIVYHVYIVRGWLKIKEIDFMKDWEFYKEKSVIWKRYGTKAA